MIAEEMQENEQMILEWLELETPAQQRHFLEHHLTLMNDQSDQFLRMLEDTPGTPFSQFFLQRNREILQSVRQNGGGIEAIRVAYVNIYSGFVLDLPDWLSGLAEEIETSDEHAFLKEQLLEARARAQDELAPVILAELSYRLAQACKEQADVEDSPNFLAEALLPIEPALQTYTRDLYPYQFAKVAYLAGRLHYQISDSSKRPGFHIQQALIFFEEVATIWTREAFASSWLVNQMKYVDALLSRYQYNGQESDLERAQSLSYELLFSDIPDMFDTLLITISLVQISFIHWSRTQDEEELEHGLKLASMARDVAHNAEYRTKYRSECAGLLSLFGAFLGAYYLQTSEKDSLERCIEVRREVLEYALPTDMLFYLWQAQLGLALLERYFLTWQAGDLEEALQLAQQALQHIQAKAMLTQEVLHEPDVMKDDEQQNEQFYATAYFALGYCLMVKHLQTWQSSAMLNQAIEYLERAVKCTPRFSPDLPIFLTMLSNALIRRHETDENLTDIQRGIAQTSSMLRGMAGENTHFTSQLYCVLGLYLSKRYDIQGNYPDLTLAIDACRYALYDVLPQTPLYATINTTLGIFLVKKHFSSGSREDIEEAVSCCDKALEATEEISQLFPFFAVNLASALQVSYIYNQDPESLEEAITILLSARRLLAANAPLQCEILVVITEILRQLYSVSGHREYIELAIDISRQALDISTRTYPRRYIFLYEFSQAQALSYTLTGSQEALQEMLKASEQALNLMPVASPYRALIFLSLSESLHQRYERTGSLEDLDRAMEHLQEIITALPMSSSLYPAMQDDLGQCHLNRFRHTHQTEELVLALKHLSRAVASSTGSTDQHLYQMHLSGARLLHALVKQEFESLEQVITEMREVLSHIREDNVQWSMCVNTLIQTLCISYELNGQRKHLEEAIALSEAALNKIAQTAPTRVSLLMNLGRAMRARSRLPGQEEDTQKARMSFEEACEKGLSLSLETALSSAELWGNWAALRGDWNEAGRAYGYAIRALDLLYLEQVLLTHKRQRLTSANSLDTLNWNWVNIYEQAAYAQAHAGLIREAVTSLELGRARELGEKLARDRADLRAIEQKYPELYLRYQAQISLLQRLENADLMGGETLLNQTMGVTSIPLIEQIRQARAMHAETLAEIRLVPGYANFRLEPNYEQIALAALPDIPLVYIVVTTMGSLALLVLASGQEPEAIWAEELKLSDLSLAKVQDGGLVGGYLAGQSISDWMRSTLTDSLPYMGTSLIQRIALRLDTLKAKGVVLIPMGGSGMIPFHAASYTMDGQKVCLLDQFDVSYTPSARVLVTVRNEASKRRSSQASTPHYLLGVGNPLPAASEGEWVQAEIQRVLQPLREYIDEARTEIDDQSPPEPLQEVSKGVWAQAEMQRLLEQAGAYIAANPASLDNQALPDSKLGHIFISSWERALHELRAQSTQPPEKLVEQGLSFFWWAAYFAQLPEISQDILSTFGAICQRIPPALPYTRLEMEGIQRLFTVQNATTFYGSRATKAALWTSLPKASILHLSCHASFRADEPLDSAFLLAQNTSLILRDLLEADEQLLALLQLAVLPACQTAVTDMQSLPNEVIGLFAGFLHTGVPSVIGTLWSVEQRSSALLMIRFYDLYLHGTDPSLGQGSLHPSTALRMAQCWLRDQTYETLETYAQEQARRGRIQLAIWLEHYLRAALAPQEDEHTRPDKHMRPYAHPYNWAAFVYYGA